MDTKDLNSKSYHITIGYGVKIGPIGTDKLHFLQQIFSIFRVGPTVHPFIRPSLSLI